MSGLSQGQPPKEWTVATTSSTADRNRKTFGLDACVLSVRFPGTSVPFLQCLLPVAPRSQDLPSMHGESPDDDQTCDGSQYPDLVIIKFAQRGHQVAQALAQAVAYARNDGCPDHCTCEIEHRKPGPMHAACAHRNGTRHTQAVQEPDDENERCVMALQERLNPGRARLKQRKSHNQSRAITVTQEEKELISQESAYGGDGDDCR